MTKGRRRGPTAEHFALWHYCLSEPVEHFDYGSQDEESDASPPPPVQDHHSTPEHLELLRELLELEEAGEAVHWPAGLSKKIAEEQLAASMQP